MAIYDHRQAPPNPAVQSDERKRWGVCPLCGETSLRYGVQVSDSGQAFQDWYDSHLAITIGREEQLRTPNVHQPATSTVRISEPSPRKYDGWGEMGVQSVLVTDDTTFATPIGVVLQTVAGRYVAVTRDRKLVLPANAFASPSDKLLSFPSVETAKVALRQHYVNVPQPGAYLQELI